MSIPRFYFQWAEEDSIGWFVFDREHTSPQGDCLPIAKAINKNQAARIRDGLNYWNEHYAPPR